jgi:PAS domain S-box-containing protein
MTTPSAPRPSSGEGPSQPAGGQFLKRFFENHHLLAAILDRDFNFLRVNAKYAEAAGKAPDFFPGKNHFDLYPHAENQRIFAEVRDTGRPFQVFAKPFHHPDQPERGVTYWDWTLTPLPDVHGATELLILTIQDVTERRKWELSMREDAYQARAIAENLPGVVFQLEKSAEGRWRFRFVGEGARELFALSPEALLADPDSLFSQVHPADREALWAETARSEETLSPLFNEHRLVRPDGGETWVQIRSTPIRPPDGGTLWNGLALDITPRKQAEERFQTIFAMSLDLICVLEMDGGTFRQANPAFEETLGYAEADLVGRRFLEFIHGDDRPVVARTFERELARGVPALAFETRFRDRCGEYRWLNWNARPDPEKRIIHAVAHDVSARKRREERLRQRERYLQALNDVAGLLLSRRAEMPWREVLDIIGPASAASRVYVFRNETGADGRLRMRHAAEWCAPGVPAEIDNPRLQHLAYQDRCPRWEAILSRGGIISGRVRDFPETEREDLAAQGILAILAIPMIVAGEFIGFIGFDNCQSERAWTRAERSFLKTAAAMLVSARERRLREKALRKSRERLELALQGTRAGLWEIDFRSDTVRINEGAAHMAGHSLEELAPVSSSEWLDFCHPEDAPSVEAAIRECREGNSRFLEIECRILHKRGHWFWVSDRGMVVEWDETGTPIRMAGTAIDITERKKAEQALRRGRNLLAEAERLAGVGSWEWDIPNDRWTLSDNWFRIHGGKKVPLSTDALMDFAHPEDAAAIREAFRKAVSETGVYAVEHRIRRASDGGIRHIQARGEVAFGPDGAPRRMFGAALDVTEKVRTETALRKSETEYRMIVENQADLVVKVDAEGRLLFVSPSYCRLFGKTEAELLGKAFMPLVHEDDREATAEAMKALFAPPHEAQMVQRAMTRIGWRWLSWSDKAILDEAGRVAEIVGVGRDITREREAEMALRESEARYRALFENAPLGIFTASPEGRFTAVNQALADMLGFSTPREVVERVTDIAREIYVHPERRAEIVETIRNSSGVATFENEYYRRDGRTFSANLNVVVLGHRPGEGPYLLGMVEDITQRKRAEAERLALERKIQETQKLESLGVLAGGIAHDFNNILMAILGNADLALELLPPMSPARGHLSEIEAASRRAADLCRQMLAYSGKGKFIIESIDLSELISEMRHLLEASISKKAVLNTDLAEAPPRIRGDATQIRQVLMNLVINASEAIGDRSGVITVATGAKHCDRAFLDESLIEDKPPEGRYAFLTVSDTGCGMDAETRRRVFEPFFTTKFTGRGLGMSAVLGIARGHKGALRLHSEPGAGTEFTLLFPVPPDAPAPPRLRAPADGTESELSGCVLLVDDEETIRTLGRQMLERIGFEVLTAADGQDALSVYAAVGDRVDLVLLDFTMPRMDGEETLAELRRFDPAVRVVLSSGYSEHELTPRFSEQGLAGFIQKPYTLARLREQLGKALSAKADDTS